MTAILWPGTVPTWPQSRAFNLNRVRRAAEVIAAMPGDDRAAMMELIEASQHKAMWPGVKGMIGVAVEERPPPK